MRILKVISLLIIFGWIAELNALEIKSVRGYFFEKNLLINIFYKDFPFQQIVLALKKQKNPVLLEYEFEIYRKRFILRDILLYRDKYYQKLYYDSEKNLYYLKDNFSLKSFEKPEEAVLFIINLESYPIKYDLPLNKDSLVLKIKVVLTYSTHLSDKLRYTKKERFKKIEIDKIVDINEILGKD